MRYEEILEFKQEIDFQGQWATIAPEVQQALEIMRRSRDKMYRGISGDKPLTFVSSPVLIASHEMAYRSSKRWLMSG